MDTKIQNLQRVRELRHRGMALVYVCLIMIVLVGFVSMAVDVGRVQVAKTQLQTATDAAARQGALGLSNIIYGQSAAAANAAVAGLDNNVDGAPLVIDQTNDVKIGYWNSIAHTFTVVTDPTTANAVRVTGCKLASRGTAIPMTFLSVLGRPTFDLTCQSTALLTPGASVNMNIPATSNPFLSGAAANTSASNGNPHNDPDWSAGSTNPPSNLGGVHVQASPQQVPSSIPINGQGSMTFDGINGGATNDFTDPSRYTADGNMDYQNCTNTAGDEHGIANMSAPINSLVAVFLDNSTPGSRSTPPDLDFSTDSERNFTTLSPMLNQMFFVGDGRNDSGQVQNFIVPSGATRLFIGTWDAYEWNNNIGSFNVTVHAPSSVTIVN
jgi:Flp pilus assembly protein TadG